MTHITHESRRIAFTHPTRTRARHRCDTAHGTVKFSILLSSYATTHWRTTSVMQKYAYLPFMQNTKHQARTREFKFTCDSLRLHVNEAWRGRAVAWCPESRSPILRCCLCLLSRNLSYLRLLHTYISFEDSALAEIRDPKHKHSAR